MSDLAEFLMARIAEDEAAALPLLDDERWAVGGLRYDGRFSMVVMSEQSEVPIANTNDEAVHIARHDPARVLAEVEAKRRIVELHSAETEACAVCVDWTHWSEVDGSPAGEDYPCPTLRALASVYSDHEAYRVPWRA